MSGKGSVARPLSVSDEQFRANYDAIDWSDAQRKADADAKAQILQDVEGLLSRFTPDEC